MLAAMPLTLSTYHRPRARPGTVRRACRAALGALLGALLASAPAHASTLIIEGAGNGHGVGMSQDGALGYAQHGASAPTILAHYYTGTTIGQAPPKKLVRVLVGSKVVKVPLERYVRGVVSAEVPSSWPAGGSRSAGDREPHLRADLARRRLTLRRLLRHPLAGLPWSWRRNGRHEQRRQGDRRADRALRGQARSHLLLRQLRWHDREHRGRLPRLRSRNPGCAASATPTKAAPPRPGNSASASMQPPLAYTVC